MRKSCNSMVWAAGILLLASSLAGGGTTSASPALRSVAGAKPSQTAEVKRWWFPTWPEADRDQILFQGMVVFASISVAMGSLLIVVYRAQTEAERDRSFEAIRSDVLRRLTAGDSLSQILGVLLATIQLPHPRLHCSIRLEDETVLAGAGPDSVRNSWPIAFERPITDSNGRRLGMIAVRGKKLGRHHVNLIERVASLAEIVVEHSALRRELEHAATHDHLTGLANRHAFIRKMGALEEQGRDRPAALFFIDLDRFKQINDHFGHHIGDVCLRQAAERIQSCFGPGDLVARSGGDEFTVLAEGLNSAETARIALRMVNLFRQPFTAAGRQVSGTVSVGVSLWPRDGRTATDIQSSADVALYEAKEAGRNQFRIHTPAMRSRAMAKMQTEQLIRHAIDCDLLELHYQPQVSIEGELLGVEALVRIRHPERGLIMPDEFIGVAEESGLIAEIDICVLAEACRQYAAWRRESFAHPARVAVNLSRVTLRDASIAQKIRTTIVAAGVEPAAIQIELTETAALKGGDTSRESLRQLQQAGISLALDDFGTGYSSLSCLHSLPIDTVKIDKSFVTGLIGNGTSLPLITAVIAAAKALGMTVIAEGVETEEQFQILRRIGCDILQGYLISAPLRPAEMAGCGYTSRRRVA
ncbi:MAG: EAL domain-containing protein [Bryobacteraceae bacterium]